MKLSPALLALVIALSAAGCAAPEEPPLADVTAFNTLRISLDNMTRVDQIDTAQEEDLRQFVWEYFQSGYSDIRAGEYNILRSAWEKRPHVALNATLPVRIADGDDSRVVYFMIATLEANETRLDGILCDSIDCSGLQSSIPRADLVDATRLFLATANTTSN